ncbi:MAG: Vitamin B12 transporter BtuB [Verrucomicrobiae bacterium]|nr:Vitamin B12 transporter BtuB [Verrucomicrobiae bacterium]
MKTFSIYILPWLCLLPIGHADDPVPLPPVVVSGAWPQVEILLLTNEVSRPQDSAGFLQRTPGAATVRNGPLTGMAQLRGLFGDRVKVIVDGTEPTPACPNHMDPPLHYLAPTTVKALTVVPGVTPVRWGGDSIGGTIIAEAAPPRFATDRRPELFGELGGNFRTSNDGRGLNGELGLALPRFSLAYAGAYQDADDYRFSGGTVADTAFCTLHQNGLLAAMTPVGQWVVDLGLTRTRDAGTPALPMDLIEDDSAKAGLKFQGEQSFGTLEGRLYYHTIDHLMDNYSLRPPGMMQMSSTADSDDFGASLGISIPADAHTFRGGAAAHLNTLEAQQENQVTNLQQDTFRHATRNRVGAYAEWETDWTDRWWTELGLRTDAVMADADAIQKFFPPSAADAAAFNNRNRSRTDINVDLTATVQFRPADYCTLGLAFARKNRAPSTLERYLWTPLSASAGQADGRTYLGNLDLDSETAHIIAGTVSFHGERWLIKATPFYNFVTDYIQGTPSARLDTAGQPVLQYQNIRRADLYGADGEARYQFTDWLAVAGTVSYVRGINRTTDDNLYRLAPLNGTVRLEHQWKTWQTHAETVLAARQSEVAAYNGEPKASGYALINLRTSYQAFGHVTVQAAVENLLDKRYADALGGINRVTGSDVPVGARLLNPGRTFVLALRYNF